MIQLKVLLLNRKSIQKSKTNHLKVISFHYKTYPIVFQSSLVPVLLTFKFLYQIRLEIRRRNYCNSFLLRILSTKPYPPFYSTTSPPRPRKAISLFLSFASYRIVRNQCDGRAILRDGSVQEASKNSREGGKGRMDPQPRRDRRNSRPIVNVLGRRGCQNPLSSDSLFSLLPLFSLSTLLQ